MSTTAIAEPTLTNVLDDRSLAEIDPAIHAVLENEKQRQNTHIELIASENFTLPAIIETTGSVLTNKYAEGYPAKRYYGGCEHVDVAESLAIERAKSLFGAEYAKEFTFIFLANVGSFLSIFGTFAQVPVRGFFLNSTPGFCTRLFRTLKR